MSADSGRDIGGLRKRVLDLWADMCLQLWRSAFAAYDLWRADKFEMEGGKSDEEISRDLDRSGIMDMPLPDRAGLHGDYGPWRMRGNDADAAGPGVGPGNRVGARRR